MEDLIRQCLGFRLGAAYRRVDRLFSRTLRRLGLSNAHAHLLACLLARPGQRIGDLARQTGLAQSTVTRLVQGLSRRKFLHRRRDPEDGRVRVIEPSARAEALRSEIQRLAAHADERIRRDLTQADLEGVFHAIEAMERLP